MNSPSLSQPLNADAVMWTVRQGQIPDTWQVYRARLSYLIQWPVFAIFLLLIGLLVVIRTDANASTLTHIVAIVVVVAFTLSGLWLTWFGIMQLVNVRDQALVLMPDGFVINTRKPVAYAFAAIEAINVRRIRYGYAVVLTLVGNQQRQQLPLDGRFGNILHRVAQINAAQVAWRHAHGAASL